MSNTFHTVVLVNGVRKEFDLDPFVDPSGGTGLYEALEVESEKANDPNIAHGEIIEVDGIQFGESRGLDHFTSCMVCDGCEDGRANKFIDGDERSAHIIPCLFEKYIKLSDTKEA